MLPFGWLYFIEMTLNKQGGNFKTSTLCIKNQEVAFTDYRLIAQAPNYNYGNYFIKIRPDQEYDSNSLVVGVERQRN